MLPATRPRPTGETLQFMQGLWELVHALAVRSKRMARTMGVTGPQRLVIRVVGQSPDATAKQISDILGIHPSTLTGVLARLERQDMIRRQTDRADRRRVRFRLTAAGRGGGAPRDGARRSPDDRPDRGAGRAAGRRADPR